MAESARPRGPIDIAVLGFPETGSESVVAGAIDDAVKKGAARVLDAIWIRKSDDGTVTVIDVDDEAEARTLLGFETDIPGLLGEEDVQDIAEEIPRGTSAAVIAWENTWAARISESVQDAGGVLLAHDRIPTEAVWEILDLFDKSTTSGRS